MQKTLNLRHGKSIASPIDPEQVDLFAPFKIKGTDAQINMQGLPMITP